MSEMRDIMKRAAERMSNDGEAYESRPKPVDPTCLSYWFPLIQAAGLPVPKTEIVRTDAPLWMWIDGKEPTGLESLLDDLRAACGCIPGPPWFLRTGMGSGKHSWDRCCHLRSLDNLAQHVYNLFEWSHMVDFIGLATDVWVVREILPVEALTRLPRYDYMPVVQEWRCFVRDGKLECLHPYWPLEALRAGANARAAIGAIYEKMLVISRDESDECRRIAEAAGAAAGGGYWSVDILKTENGLYLTDMAEGKKSWHWPDCEYMKTGSQ